MRRNRARSSGRGPRRDRWRNGSKGRTVRHRWVSLITQRERKPIVSSRLRQSFQALYLSIADTTPIPILTLRIRSQYCGFGLVQRRFEIVVVRIGIVDENHLLRDI